ncbi:hypothetical protein K8R42_04430 [bacterium]|nr:hypothetical protein [bacterium]
MEYAAPDSLTAGNGSLIRWQGQALLYLMYVGLLLITFLTQAPLTLEQGLGWDGVAYGQMATQLQAGQQVVADRPFCYRLGTPWLASLLTEHLPLTSSFMLINLLPILFYPVLLLRLWRQFAMRDGVAWLFIFIFVLSWHATPRFNFFYPATPDPWLWFFVLLLLPELRRSRLGTIWYPLLMFVGVLFRELVLWVALAALIGRILTTRRTDWRSDGELRRHLIALIGGAMALLLTHLLVEGTGEYTYLRAGVGMFWHKPFPVWINGWFGAFGILLIPALCSWRWLQEWVRANPQAAVWLGGLWLLGWFGGSDTIRIMFWSAPLAFVLLYDHYRAHTGFYHRWWVLLLLLLVHLLSQRWGTPIPDYDPAAVSQLPLFTPQGISCPYLDLEPQHASHWVSKIALAQYFAASLLLAWSFLHWRKT